MKLVTSLVLAGLSWLLLSAPGLAHHSTLGLYNEDQTAEITGVVKQWRFVNPHPILILEVTGADGQTRDWDISFGGPAVNILRRQGYTADTFKVGDVVVVKGFAASAEDMFGMLARGPVTRSDGTPVLQPAQ
jgi:hypothetical protein